MGNPRWTRGYTGGTKKNWDGPQGLKKSCIGVSRSEIGGRGGEARRHATCLTMATQDAFKTRTKGCLRAGLCRPCLCEESEGADEEEERQTCTVVALFHLTRHQKIHVLISKPCPISVNVHALSRPSPAATPCCAQLPHAQSRLPLHAGMHRSVA